jgi:hypothetical protein
MECLSTPKSREFNRMGDDVVVSVPDKFYAVFDGATDTSGTFRAEISSGRFAATAAADAMLRLVLRPEGPGFDPQIWLACMNKAIAEGLRQRGFPQARASTTAAMAVPMGSDMFFLLVGDSGLRINGHELIHLTKDVDLLFTHVRLCLREVLAEQGLAGDALEASTRQLVFKGLDQAHPFSISDAQTVAIIDKATAACQGRLSPDALTCIPAMVRRGISGGQYPFANQLNHSLAYASLDGTVTRGADMCHFSRPLAQLQSIELFTDGYMSCPVGGISVQDWETNFFQAEAQDPHKIAQYAGVKGSTEAYFSDDRSVLVLSFERP